MRFFVLLLSLCAVAGIAGACLLGPEKAADKVAVNTGCQVPDNAQVAIPGGSFTMGSTEYYEEEGTPHTVKVASFSIDKFAVTNAQFGAFVRATGYVTEAERKPSPMDFPDIPPDQLAAGGAVFVSPDEMGKRPSNTTDMEWWRFVKGADWRHPEGPDSSIKGKGNYPVVQVTYHDALAYATWAGRTLPTEEQMEYAARGGLDGKTYAWGDEFAPQGKYQANTWQGRFPDNNTDDDGFGGVAPVGCFPANGYGLYDAIGNVWQWTSSLYTPGVASTQTAKAASVARVIKGGSFLCSSNFCRRYRPAARQPQESNFSAAHIGFRTVSVGSPT